MLRWFHPPECLQDVTIFLMWLLSPLKDFTVLLKAGKTQRYSLAFSPSPLTSSSHAGLQHLLASLAYLVPCSLVNAASEERSSLMLHSLKLAF